MMKLGIPRFGIYSNILRAFLEDLGIEVIMPGKISREMIKLGVANSSDMMCFPFKTTLGQQIWALEQGATDLIMWNSCGLCRLKHYYQLQELTLRGLGYKFNMHMITRGNVVKTIKQLGHISYFDAYRRMKKFYGRIKEVGELALQSQNCANLPGKCGIFAQSAVVSELNKGRPVSDILMGVCRALVGNYLAVLGKGKRLLHPIVFQGATALNQALVKCFEDELGSCILVPKDCSYMGAIGIAALTQEHMNGHPTKFRGVNDVLNASYGIEVSYCEDCENSCELLSLYCDGELVGRSGSRCEKNNL